MKLMKLVASLLLLSCLAAAGAVGRKISDYTETLSPQDAWYLEIAVPGVTNYRVGFGTIVTGVVARVPASIGGASNAVENLNGKATNTAFYTAMNLAGPALPMTSNAVDVGSHLLPLRTNWVNDLRVKERIGLKPSMSNATLLSFDFAAFDPAARKYNFNFDVTGVPVNVGLRADTTFNFGYNNKPDGGGAEDLTDTALYVQFENWYEPILGTGYMEYWLGFYGTNNTPTFRPYQVTVRTDGLSCLTDFKSTQINFSQLDGTQNVSVQNGVMNLHNGTFFRSHVNNTALFTCLNAAADAYLTLFSLNANNYFHFGGVLAGVVVPAGTMGIGTLSPASSLDVTGQVRAVSAIITNMPGTGDHVAVNAFGLLMRTNITGGSVSSTNADVYISLEVFGHHLVSSNLWVTGTISGASLSVVDFYANNLILTNALGSNQVRLGHQDLTNYSYNPFVIAGVGGANTNFTLQAGQPEVIINAFTNVSLRGVMGGSATKIDYIRVTMTNGSGTDRTLEFSPSTNSFRFSSSVGTNAPSVITNMTQLHATFRVSGSNVLVKADYYPWP